MNFKGWFIKIDIKYYDDKKCKYKLRVVYLEKFIY